TAVPFDGARPVAIEWAAVPGVDHYVVTALSLDELAGAGVLAPIATFDTADARAAMPASLFARGGSFVLTVTAVQDHGVDFAGGALRRIGFPRATREAVTARLWFASSCGDGAVDAS